MISQNNEIGDLEAFIESQCGEDRFRIEKDFGYGFVKLRSSEAERRQAAQDIRSSEDIVIELLRNSRDAGAKNIFISSSKVETIRSLVIIDDGDGIPESMRFTIFEPRVTSKLDTAHMDRWGMHGRGMALYSVKVNSDESFVSRSVEGQGTSIVVRADVDDLGEKTDQSTFPAFVIADGKLNVRGPKNIIRTIAEFALEHRNDLNVYVGSPADIAATLYAYGMSTISATERTFVEDVSSIGPTKLLCYAHDSYDLAEYAKEIGLDISERTARRIMNGKIASLDPMMDLVNASLDSARSDTKKKSIRAKSRHKIHFAADDLSHFSDSLIDAFSDIAEKYYLDMDVMPTVSVKDDKLVISFDLIDAES